MKQTPLGAIFSATDLARHAVEIDEDAGAQEFVDLGRAGIVAAREFLQRVVFAMAEVIDV